MQIWGNQGVSSHSVASPPCSFAVVFQAPSWLLSSSHPSQSTVKDAWNGGIIHNCSTACTHKHLNTVNLHAHRHTYCLMQTKWAGLHASHMAKLSRNSAWVSSRPFNWLNNSPAGFLCGKRWRLSDTQISYSFSIFKSSRCTSSSCYPFSAKRNWFLFQTFVGFSCKLISTRPCRSTCRCFHFSSVSEMYRFTVEMLWSLFTRCLMFPHLFFPPVSSKVNVLQQFVLQKSVPISLHCLTT